MSTPPGPSDPYGSQTPGDGYGQTPPPGYYGGGNAMPPSAPPPNYLVWAIISILLCWPLGIPAIIFSTQVNSKWQQGDQQGALDASRKAKTFALWATILGAISIILWIVLSVAGVLAGATAGSMGY